MKEILVPLILLLCLAPFIPNKEGTSVVGRAAVKTKVHVENTASKVVSPYRAFEARYRETLRKDSLEEARKDSVEKANQKKRLLQEVKMLTDWHK